MFKNQIINAAIIFIVFLAFGTGAFYWAEDGWSLSDAFYMTVITITTVGYGEVHPLSEWGRVVAMVIIFSGIAILGFVGKQVTSFVVSSALNGFFVNKRVAKKIARLSDHTIICGYGNRGRSLVTSLVKLASIQSGETARAIAVVDLQNQWNDDELNPDENVYFILGDARDDNILLMAGIDKAAQVIVVAGTDQSNLGIANKVKKMTERYGFNPIIIAGVEHYNARSFLVDRLASKGVRVIGFMEQAFILMMRDLAISFIKQKKISMNERLNISIDVDDDMVKDLVRAIVMVFQLTASNKVKIIVHTDSTMCEEDFNSSFPEYDACADIVWKTEKLGYEVLDAGIDLAIFSHNNSLNTLESAERYLLNHSTMSNDQVIACIRNEELVEDYNLKTIEGKREPKMVTLFQYIENNRGYVTHAMEEDGKQLHEQYRTKVAVEKDPGPWNDLPEFLKDSNRMAALHADIHQALWHFFKNERDYSDSDILDYLSETEHMRWMAFHVMSGWKKSHDDIIDRQQRMLMKVHPNIVPYDQLDEGTKKFDLQNVLAAIDNL